ncbi:MAG: InlB B-repeat-containing protein [Lachnospiraceae bacterium]|nr:InlB B-repeat-containing protein [Lachnospiraceae bacterium]
MIRKPFRRMLTGLLAAVLAVTSALPAFAAGTAYTITYKPGNYAKETAVYTQKTTVGASVKLKTAVYTRTGYTQSRWLVANASDDDILLSLGQTINTATYYNRFKAYSTLYLVPGWTANTYYVKYVNPVTGKSITKTYTYDKSYAYLSSAAFSRSGYTLKGWSTISGTSTDSTTYPTGSVIQPGSRLTNLTTVNKRTITVYAVWERN